MTIQSGEHFLPARRALADDVYDAVLGLLMDQVIEPGSRASIDGIARQLNVSPTPVREALARLAQSRAEKDAQNLLFAFRDSLEPGGGQSTAEAKP